MMDRSRGNVLASSLGIGGKYDRVWYSDPRGTRSVKAPNAGDQVELVLIPRDRFNALALQALALVPVADAAPLPLALGYLLEEEQRDEK